jgi:peptidoglycan/xylan/chitin deacetylase (PgdA/CDA1 family)/2-polyprenyl-3-methyl-5-hydroxy-6-metoxy-1,4-benzoquinol methylase
VPFFSVVIAARDAAATLADTIAALRDQSFTDWEAIVVDDGSRDDTPQIAEQRAAADRRIRLLHASSRGVSAARNDGIAAATGAWLLFLDADDTIFPDAFEAWHRAIHAEPEVDAWCGAWVRVGPGGDVVTHDHWPIVADMFPVFARLSAFAIHSCVVRRSLVLRSGGFDIGYVTCEDWDLWQRLARAGARFGSIPDDVARYHMRPRSASLAARQMLVDGLRVITTGHSADPRVASPLDHYANGMPNSNAAAVRFAYLCWPAGLLLGSGGDARSLLDVMPHERAGDIDPSVVANAIFRSATLPRCAGASAWGDLWPAIERRLSHFLAMLEKRTEARLLARRVVAALARSIFEHLPEASPLTRVGHTQLHTVDIRTSVQSVRVLRRVERVVVRAREDRTVLGFLELPACDGSLDAAVVRDAMAHEFGWSILRSFFDATVYNDVGRRAAGRGMEAVRHGVVLGAAPGDDQEWIARRHDAIGWTVFLQELWDHPDWPVAAFYDPDWPSPDTTRAQPHGDWIRVDVLDPIADACTADSEINAELCVGGVPVCCTRMSADDHVIRGSRLRAQLTTAAGLQLLHVAVREALIGAPQSRGTLRDRLARRRARNAAMHEYAPAISGAAPSAAACIASLRARDRGAAIVAARRVGPAGSPASRRVDLPSRAHRDVVAAACAAKEPIVSGSRWRRARIAYAPEVLYDGAQQPVPAPFHSSFASTSSFGRHHFEALFARRSDPWSYTTAYESRKYEQTLSLLPPVPVHRALEIGCAEGHFTERLAAHVDTLQAVDISAIALERATVRCAHRDGVSFARLDLVRDELPSGNDLIVCSEVLYYVGTVDDLRRAGCKLRDALRPGGRLLTAHANVASDDPASAGYAWDVPYGAKTIRDVLSTTPGLQLARELRTALYSVMEFERSDEPRVATVLSADFAMPEPHVAKCIRWSAADATALTRSPGATLPILMYHRLSTSSAPATARYALSPDRFTEQLAYLRDAGFQSVSLADWTAALLRREPLPGRPVAITFDDAYVDFESIALPLLERHGFAATLFVVTSYVDRWNAWDAARGDPVRLMDWPAIQRVAAAGIEIGAHSATHPPMTGLTPAEIACEASRARAAIQERLKQPVTAFAYPYGDSDPVVEHLIGGCGFLTGVTCRFGVSALHDRPLRLPRIEITGSDSLADFIRKLGA